MYNGIANAPEGEQSFIYQEIVTQDCYGIKQFAQQGLDIATFIDIGANIGIFTLLAAHLYPWSKIIAIEPAAYNANRICQNIGNLNNIQVLNKAFGDGQKVQFCAGVYDGIGTTQVDENGEPSCTFRQLEVDWTKPVWVKSDCEGAETAFFTGENFDFLQKATVISMEFHPDKYSAEVWSDFRTRIEQTHQVLKYYCRSDCPLGDYILLKK